MNASKIKTGLKQLLKKKGIVSDCLVNLALVGEKEMRKLSKRYLGEEEVHNVLSFPDSEIKGEFTYPVDNVIRLGEIVICFQKAVEEAKKEGKLIDDKVQELANHGALHLLGEHHEQ